MEQDVAVKRGRGVRPADMKMTLADFIDKHWKHSLDIKKQTKADYQNTINKYILPYFGEMAMSSIKPLDIESWTAKLKHEEKYFGKPLSAYTIQKYVNLLASILKVAKENNFIHSSPFEKLKRKKVKPQRQATPLEISQVYELTEVLPEHLRLLVWIPFFTGLRPSEVLGLTLEDIDFQNKRINVHHQISRDNVQVHEDYLKTSSSRRVVPLAQTLEVKIKDHVTKFGLGPEQLLFKNRTGGVLRYKDAAHSFRKAARPLGIPEREGLHVLRHTFVSTLIRKNTNVKSIQILLGHREISETLDTYGHLFPNDLDNAIAKLDEIFNLEPIKSSATLTLAT
jgi:integrase